MFNLHRIINNKDESHPYYTYIIPFAFFCKQLGTPVHYIGHAIGFWHEHTRPNRDDFVTINYPNVMTLALSSFNKQSLAHSENKSVEYDYGSVMHHGPKVSLYGFWVCEVHSKRNFSLRKLIDCF